MAQLISQPGTAAAVASQALIARLERLPPTPLLRRARVIVGTATFFDGYNFIAIAFVLPALAAIWHLGPTQIGLLITAGNVGALIGALGFGWLSERCGRLPIVAWSIGIYGVFSLVCAFAWDAGSLAAFRFLQGIGLGGEVPVAAAYIAELTRAHGRGRFYLLYEVLFAVGLFAAALLGFWLVPHWGWRSMFVVGALPALLIPALLRSLPESPRWLLAHHRAAEAESVVSTFEASYTATGAQLPPVPPATAPEPMIAASWRDLLGPRYLRRTLVVWTVWVSAYIVTYGPMAWLPTLFRTVLHLPLSTAIGYGLIMQAAGLAGGYLCAAYIDVVGRRVWIAVALVMAGLAYLALPLTGTLNATGVVVIASIASFFISSVSLGAYLFTAELYPTRVRALATSIGTAWLRLAAAAGPLIVSYLLVRGGVPSIFFVFGLIPLFGGIVTAIWAIEGRGRQLEEISP